MEKADRPVALQLTGVKKVYTLGQIGTTTLTARLQSRWARLRGREDPNLPLGAEAVKAGTPFAALDGIDLTVYRGEVVGIIGSNGAGKSTLLKLISRITAPTAGQIRICGRVASLLEVGIGFHGEMTGRENICLNGAILGMTAREIRDKMEQIIAFSGIGPFIDTPVKRYSSGMYVRLAFAVAAYLESEILILDEVLAVGDMAFQTKCLETVRNTRGKTVLYVSHNMHTVRQLCTRCIVLEQGRILYDGEVEGAIAVYTRSRRQGLRQTVELETLPRGAQEHGREVRLQRFAFGREPVFPPGEAVDFALTLWAAQRQEDVCLRCMIYGADAMPVCMASTRTGQMTLEPGQQTLHARLDLSCLAPGSYSVKLALYRVNGLGAEAHWDVVDKAAAFTVENGPVTNGMAWQHRWWGNIRLPDIQIQ